MFPSKRIRIDVTFTTFLFLTWLYGLLAGAALARLPLATLAFGAVVLALGLVTVRTASLVIGQRAALAAFNRDLQAAQRRVYGGRC